jgi:hypothetical protein
MIVVINNPKGQFIINIVNKKASIINTIKNIILNINPFKNLIILSPLVQLKT